MFLLCSLFFSDQVLQVTPATEEALKYLNDLFHNNDFEVCNILFLVQTFLRSIVVVFLN